VGPSPARAGGRER
jgi:hypothetical protein